jgi:hypothetical protein
VQVTDSTSHQRWRPIWEEQSNCQLNEKKKKRDNSGHGHKRAPETKMSFIWFDLPMPAAGNGANGCGTGALNALIALNCFV